MSSLLFGIFKPVYLRVKIKKVPLFPYHSFKKAYIPSLACNITDKKALLIRALNRGRNRRPLQVFFHLFCCNRFAEKIALHFITM